MPARARQRLPAALFVATLLTFAVVAPALGAGSLQSRISATRNRANALQAQISADSSRIAATAGGLAAAQRRLDTLNQQLAARANALIDTEQRLLAARTRLLNVENELARSSNALSANLLATYEYGKPDVVDVVFEANSFADLLDRLDFMRRIATHDAALVTGARAARSDVSAQADQLGALELRDKRLAAALVTAQGQANALATALARKQAGQLAGRAGASAALHSVHAQLASLETREARIFGQSAPGAGLIRIDTGGMVRPPPGAPRAVAEVIAAGNAIATLPYIYGGGHASFQANGYDCSGSVSYALAAAGLVTSPMVSGAFESWGEPGPGKWITVYANAGHVFMYVAGWRFDTVALAEGGTRWSQSATGTGGFVVRHPAGL